MTLSYQLTHALTDIETLIVHLKDSTHVVCHCKYNVGGVSDFKETMQQYRKDVVALARELSVKLYGHECNQRFQPIWLRHDLDKKDLTRSHLMTEMSRPEGSLFLLTVLLYLPESAAMVFYSSCGTQTGRRNEVARHSGSCSSSFCHSFVCSRF